MHSWPEADGRCVSGLRIRLGQQTQLSGHAAFEHSPHPAKGSTLFRPTSSCHQATTLAQCLPGPSSLCARVPRRKWGVGAAQHHGAAQQTLERRPHLPAQPHACCYISTTQLTTAFTFTRAFTTTFLCIFHIFITTFFSYSYCVHFADEMSDPQSTHIFAP